jgi:hypothetical protein
MHGGGHELKVNKIVTGNISRLFGKLTIGSAASHCMRFMVYSFGPHARVPSFTVIGFVHRSPRIESMVLGRQRWARLAGQGVANSGFRLRRVEGLPCNTTRSGVVRKCLDLRTQGAVPRLLDQRYEY